MRHLKDLQNEYARMRQLFTTSHKDLELRNELISNWSIGEHLHHLLKADHLILAVTGEDRKELDGKISLLGRLVLITGTIPRGRGRAPELTLPEHVPVESLSELLAQVLSTLAAVSSESSWYYSKSRKFRHPVFGPLTNCQTLRFMVVHHRHHWKLIRDIYSGRNK